MSDSAIPPQGPSRSPQRPGGLPDKEVDYTEIANAIKQAVHIKEDFEEGDLDPSVSVGQNRGSTKQRMGINLHVIDKAAERAGIDNTSIQNLRFLGQRLENMDFQDAFDEYNEQIDGLRNELGI